MEIRHLAGNMKGQNLPLAIAGNFRTIAKAAEHDDALDSRFFVALDDRVRGICLTRETIDRNAAVSRSDSSE
ncbi:hypothetical protein ABIB82_004286 [Bradyrhizobium sp. i1.8.4]|uniref:hypothetical protein n=1 Tax=unclassified Bradyrhizobium TaxID=2631580 RepID=UPI003D20061C